MYACIHSHMLYVHSYSRTPHTSEQGSVEFRGDLSLLTDSVLFSWWPESAPNLAGGFLEANYLGEIKGTNFSQALVTLFVKKSGDDEYLSCSLEIKIIAHPCVLKDL